jgi:hypothetical protein
MASAELIRYFVRYGAEPWAEVEVAAFVSAERNAGFHNTMGRPAQPATGGFGNGHISGRVVYVAHATPDQYDFDPGFRDIVWPRQG